MTDLKTRIENYLMDLPPEAQPAALNDYLAGRKQLILELIYQLELLNKILSIKGPDEAALQIEYLKQLYGSELYNKKDF